MISFEKSGALQQYQDSQINISISARCCRNSDMSTQFSRRRLGDKAVAARLA